MRTWHTLCPPQPTSRAVQVTSGPGKQRGREREREMEGDREVRNIKKTTQNTLCDTLKIVWKVFAALQNFNFNIRTFLYIDVIYCNAINPKQGIDPIYFFVGRRGGGAVGGSYMSLHPQRGPRQIRFWSHCPKACIWFILSGHSSVITAESKIYFQEMGTKVY